MIINPYKEVISLHDMNILDFKVENNKAFLSLNQAILVKDKKYQVIDDPLIIINDLLEIKANEDYPIRITLINKDNVYNIEPKNFTSYNFTILEEAYGHNLVHLYGIATKYSNGYDFMIDIHYCGDIEIKWNEKIPVEVWHGFWNY